MYYKKGTYKVYPDKMAEFNQFLSQILLPVQKKNGAELVGKWLVAALNEVIVIWRYPSLEEYHKIQERVDKEQPLKPSFHCTEEFLTSLGEDEQAKQNVTVSGVITDEQGKVLLVKTYWRSDTWELPGGGVEVGETLDQALCREIREETGIHVKLSGITGVYSNGQTIAVVFRGKKVGGKVTTSDETQAVDFFSLNKNNISDYIKRGKFIPRVLDGLKGDFVPYEAFQVRPYKLLNRYDKETF